MSSTYTLDFSVCYGSPNDVFAVSSGFVRLYTLRFKEKNEGAAVVANANADKRGSVQRFRFAAHLNFQSVKELYKNFTRMSPSKFEFIINLIGEKSRKRHSVQERHFCSRNVCSDAMFLGKW